MRRATVKGHRQEPSSANAPTSDNVRTGTVASPEGQGGDHRVVRPEFVRNAKVPGIAHPSLRNGHGQHQIAERGVGHVDVVLRLPRLYTAGFPPELLRFRPAPGAKLGGNRAYSRASLTFLETDRV